MLSAANKIIGPFVNGVRNLRREAEATLERAQGFSFPRERFARLGLQGRLAAVAFDSLLDPPTRLIFFSGMIEGEGPRLEFAVLTRNPDGIVSSKLAFLILADFEGQANVVVKVEEIEELGAARAVVRKPRIAPATVSPSPELDRRRLGIETSPSQGAISLIHRLVIQHGKQYLRAKPFEEAHPDLVDKFVKSQMPEIAFLDAVYDHYGWPRPK
jgi:hypothetical protein